MDQSEPTTQQESSEDAKAPDSPDSNARVEMRGFGWALKLLDGGYKVCRRGWNGPNQYLELQRPDPNSKMTRPYIYIKTAQEDLVPWVASQTDLLTLDWELYGAVPESTEGVGQDLTPN